MPFDGHETVRTDRNGIDPAIYQKSGEFRVVARRLTAKSNLGAGLVGSCDDILDHPFHGLVLLVEQFGKLGRIPVDTQCELSEIVGPDGKAVEAFRECVR